MKDLALPELKIILNKSQTGKFFYPKISKIRSRVLKLEMREHGS